MYLQDKIKNQSFLPVDILFVEMYGRDIAVLFAILCRVESYCTFDDKFTTFDGKDCFFLRNKDLIEKYKIPQYSVTKELKFLKQIGFIETYTKSTFDRKIYYHINTNNIIKVCEDYLLAKKI